MEEPALPEAQERALRQWVIGNATPSLVRPQAGHRHGGGAQKRILGHSQGFKQDVGLGGLGDYPSAQAVEARVKTMTYDNVKEISGHAMLDEALRSKGYFAPPFASWGRGSSENFNGLLRQYVPKKRQMASITNEEIKMIENRLNNRPRKQLGFRTPAEVVHQSLYRVALRA